MINDLTINFIKDTYKKEAFKINPTCYFYDLTKIDENIKRLEENFPEQISLYYAMKANPHKEIMNTMKNNSFVKGIEIASSGELDIALNYYKSSKIIFTGPGKTEYELAKAISKKINLINVESIVEAIRINNIAKKLNIDNVNILIRVNLNYALTDSYEQMSGCSTKMGIDEDVLTDSLKYINNLERITIKGVHVFAASGVLDYKALIKSQVYIFELVKKIEQEGYNIDIIDFGGGLGIDYTNSNKHFDVLNYSLELKKIIEKYKFQNKEIIMELGTYLVGNAGYYTSKIIDIKKIKNKKHIIIAGGVNHMGLPLEMQRKHPVYIINENNEKLYDEQESVYKEKADISGPLCMVTDKLSWDDYLEKAEIGDIVVFRQAGAYCYGEGMHDFLSHMYPEELIFRS